MQASMDRNHLGDVWDGEIFKEVRVDDDSSQPMRGSLYQEFHGSDRSSMDRTVGNKHICSLGI